MPAPTFRARDGVGSREPLEQILDRVQRDLPEAVGLAVSLHDRTHDPAGMVLAARGVGQRFVDAQLDGLGGPAIDAFEHQVPVLSPQLWADDRWPALNPESLAARSPEDKAVWTAISGAAATPGVWRADATVVLSAVLSQPADAATITTLIGYEQLMAAAMMTDAAREGSQIADMLAVLQSRGAIEQAKGAIMGALRCDADTAWSMLRRASHDSNVKLRVLAVALIELIGGAPAEQPAVGAPIVPDEAARRAAGLLWAVLSAAK